MIFIFVVLLVNNHILVHHSNNNDEPDIPNLEEILEEIITDDIMDVDKIVKKYMLTHGIDKVRGGSYKNEVLEEWQIKSLEHELQLLKPKNEQSKELSKIEKFVNLYNESNIDAIITHIISIRNSILKLKEMDRLTHFDFDVDNISNAIDKNNKLTKLREEYQKYSNIYSRQRHLDINIQKKITKLEQEIKELDNDITKLINMPHFGGQQLHMVLNIIDSSYSNFLRYTDTEQLNQIENDLIVKLYRTKIFNTDIKRKIKEFKSPFGSTEEEILEKYKALLKRKLSLS